LADRVTPFGGQGLFPWEKWLIGLTSRVWARSPERAAVRRHVRDFTVITVT
jgi:hypothetical protein